MTPSPASTASTPSGRQLLFGERARESLSRAFAGFPEEISYVCAEAGALEPLATPTALAQEGVWFPSGGLLADPAWLGALIRQSGQELGTTDLQVAASLFVQGYAYRVLMVAVACLTTARVLPDCSAEGMALSLSKGRARAVGYLRPRVVVFAEDPLSPAQHRVAVEQLLRTAIERHLERLVAATQQCVRVGARLLWGNVAASAAVAFRTMDGCIGPSVRPLGQLFFELAPPPLQGLGSFLALEVAGQRGWFWERTNCCLFERLPGKTRCSDCSLTPARERRAAYLEALSRR